MVFGRPGIWDLLQHKSAHHVACLLEKYWSNFRGFPLKAAQIISFKIGPLCQILLNPPLSTLKRHFRCLYDVKGINELPASHHKCLPSLRSLTVFGKIRTVFKWDKVCGQNVFFWWWCFTAGIWFDNQLVSTLFLIGCSQQAAAQPFVQPGPCSRLPGASWCHFLPDKWKQTSVCL